LQAIFFIFLSDRSFRQCAQKSALRFGVLPRAFAPGARRMGWRHGGWKVCLHFTALPSRIAIDTVCKKRYTWNIQKIACFLRFSFASCSKPALRRGAGLRVFTLFFVQGRALFG
jgi:hypothetical protein